MKVYRKRIYKRRKRTMANGKLQLFLTRKSAKFFVLGFVLVALILFIVFGGKIGFLSFAVKPLQNAFYAVGDGVSNFFSGFTKGEELEKQIEQLQIEKAQLELNKQQLEQALKESALLREFDDFVIKNSQYNVLPARVIAKPSGQWFSSFEIDVGSRHGVAKDMVVVADGGVAGRVTEVSEDRSTVVSIIDVRSSLGGILDRTRDHGIVKGNIQSGWEEETCRMYYLPIETELFPGDLVLTSGLGGVFPKGLVVGNVVEVSRENVSDTNRFAAIKPAVNFKKLEVVLVLRSGLPDDT